ncbi:cysteine desulfurase family protein (TIGR01976 family) [Hamadaea flava]|uniref:Cysteine desulfurase-like protein n=1 Tax=Hamadaea flava TaxID=1742688 RepID=A0ABV8LPF6_9ACTN|nr:cysteine desulfurase-like protein [Hamadaea flava]MCP2323287.1 cysteine desulfurase family protein (TIGR01976 family) [Hamadaea flava]
MGALPIESVRVFFPAFANGVIRLDGPGGSQTPQPVLDAITGYLSASNANLGGVFAASEATGDLVAGARAAAAAFLGAASPAEVGFGFNATSVNFNLSRAATRDVVAGDEIVVTALDHDANIAPWTQAAADRGLVVKTVGLDGDGRLDMVALAAAIGQRTRIVAFPYANNATGTAVDVAAVVQLAHAAGAIAWADATHWAPHFPTVVGELGVDVAICSAYKFFGPHLGLFYVRERVADRWRPHQAAHAVAAPGAARFEHGTLAFEALAGLVAALEYVDSVGWAAIVDHERRLGQRFLDGLPDGIRLHGLPAMDGRTATFALTVPGHAPVEVAKALASRGIAAGAGMFHAPAVFDALGITGGAVRVGFLHYHSEADVDATLTALRSLV